MTRHVPGLSERWADRQLDLLAELEDAAAAVAAAPYESSPPLCRLCPCVRGRRCLVDAVLEHDDTTMGGQA